MRGDRRIKTWDGEFEIVPVLILDCLWGRGMSDHLATYLNDHLTGARFAVEMLGRLRDSTKDALFRRRLAELLQQIEDDRAVLQDLVERLGAPRNAIKEAGAWLAEKASRIKLHTPDEEPLSTFETLEALSLGVLGKLKLWQALSLVSSDEPLLSGLNYGELSSRARVQHDQLEAYRLEAAQAALLDTSQRSQTA